MLPWIKSGSIFFIICFPGSIFQNVQKSDNKKSVMAVTIDTDNEIVIIGRVRDYHSKQIIDVSLRMYGKNHKDFGDYKWSTDITFLDYSPKIFTYFSYVNITDKEIFLHTTWNNKYITVDKKTGKILDKYLFDDCLLKYDSFKPLKVNIIEYSTGRVGPSR